MKRQQQLNCPICRRDTNYTRHYFAGNRNRQSKPNRCERCRAATPVALARLRPVCPVCLTTYQMRNLATEIYVAHCTLCQCDRRPQW